MATDDEELLATNQGLWSQHEGRENIVGCRYPKLTFRQSLSQPTAAQLLKEAAQLINSGWARGALARGADGNAIDPCDPGARYWSVLGAILRVCVARKIDPASPIRYLADSVACYRKDREQTETLSYTTLHCCVFSGIHGPYVFGLGLRKLIAEWNDEEGERGGGFVVYLNNITGWHARYGEPLAEKLKRWLPAYNIVDYGAP
jgi:hypothetical protein